jgi:hypothetical protein
MMDTSIKTIIVLIYHRNKLIDLIYIGFLTSIIQYSPPLKDKIMTFLILVLQIHTTFES